MVDKACSECQRLGLAAQNADSVSSGCSFGIKSVCPWQTSVNLAYGRSGRLFSAGKETVGALRYKVSPLCSADLEAEAVTCDNILTSFLGVQWLP